MKAKSKLFQTFDQMMEEDSGKMALFFITQLAKIAVDTNAETFDISLEATVLNKRVKIENRMTVTPINN